MTSRRLFALLISLALAVTACGGASSEGVEISDTPSAVVITSGTGNVSITAVDEGANVTAEVSASGEQPDWSAELVGSELIIDDGCGDRDDCEVDFTIEVAGTADISLSSADGGITIVDMNSTVTIAGAASNVVLNGITGPIDVALTEGDVLGARLVSTDASFTTQSGDLDVTLTEVFDSLTVISADGNVTAQVPGGGYDIDATADGELDIKVDDVDGAASSILMRADTGDVTIYRR